MAAAGRVLSVCVLEWRFEVMLKIESVGRVDCKSDDVAVWNISFEDILEACEKNPGPFSIESTTFECQVYKRKLDFGFGQIERRIISVYLDSVSFIEQKEQIPFLLRYEMRVGGDDDDVGDDPNRESVEKFDKHRRFDRKYCVMNTHQAKTLCKNSVLKVTVKIKEVEPIDD